ncbi:MAG: serine hydrolase [Candidatus Nealsonbacteria bacterium]
MKTNLKTCLIALLLSLPFWLGTNLLEKNLKDFFFWNKITSDEIFAAQVSLEERLWKTRPILKSDVKPLELSAESAISLYLGDDGQETVLFKKNANGRMPIASLTKLMTAKVVFDEYDLEKEITVSKEAVLQEEDLGQLVSDRVYQVEYLLYPMLIESSNDAAFSLAADYEGMTENKFVSLMNKKAREMGLLDTSFFNTTGLDPNKKESENEINLSTAFDLANLAKNLLDNHFLWEITTTQIYDQYGPVLNNTNGLLAQVSGITGSKTGYTKKAGSCMLLVLRAPKNKGVIINILLNSKSRSEEMKRIINWSETAYQW